VTIQIANGTYTSNVILKSFVGSGRIYIQGNETTPASVLLGNSGQTFIGTNITGTYHLKDFKLNGGSNAIVSEYSTYIEFSNLDFGTYSGTHLLARDEGMIKCAGSYKISGNAGYHIQANFFGEVRIQGSYTITFGSGVSLTYFANTLVAGVIYVNVGGAGFSGSFTGKRYQATNNGVVYTNTGDVNYFPGTTAGTVSSGGIYT
jgi:hypothetical protein